MSQELSGSIWLCSLFSKSWSETQLSCLRACLLLGTDNVALQFKE